MGPVVTPAYVAKKIRTAAAAIEVDVAAGHVTSMKYIMEKAYWWCIAEQQGEFFYRRVSEILAKEIVEEVDELVASL
jgi:hypothetical protein